MSQSDTTPRPQRKGPWFHRFLIHLCNVLLALLVYWLLGFVMKDIGTLKGPNLAEVEKRHVDATVLAEFNALRRQTSAKERTIRNQRAAQAGAKQMRDSLQQTIGQLVQLQRLSFEKGVAMPDSELQALQKSREGFLKEQQRIQALQATINEADGEAAELRSQADALNATLADQRKKARAEFNDLVRRHNLLVAGLKLLVLVPLSLAVAWLLAKKRGGTYAPMLYACGIAVFLKLGLVIHEHFPTVYFKYVALLVALGIVVKALIYLLRMLVTPKKDWLLKQYREAYEKFLCPICSFPIRRGPRTHLFWTARTVKKLPVPQVTEAEKETPYTCPSCGTPLHEACKECGSVRAALMPACDHCGATKEVMAAV